jgi:preprotein translocase subunit YajC
MREEEMMRLKNGTQVTARGGEQGTIVNYNHENDEYEIKIMGSEIRVHEQSPTKVGDESSRRSSDSWFTRQRSRFNW